MDGRPFIDATTIGVLVALVVVVASILASRRKPVAPPLPRGDGLIVLECVQLEERSRTAAAAAASTRWIRCHEFGANIKAVRSIPKASADATYGAILLIEPLRQFEGSARPSRCPCSSSTCGTWGAAPAASCPSTGVPRAT